MTELEIHIHADCNQATKAAEQAKSKLQWTAITNVERESQRVQDHAKWSKLTQVITSNCFVGGNNILFFYESYSLALYVPVILKVV